MISGMVTANKEALIRIQVHGPHGGGAELDGSIDTGFNGHLTLPHRLIADLALSFAGTTRAVLGDGSEAGMDVFEAVVLWDGRERDVAVLAADGAALVGMSLLTGYRLTLDVKVGGSVVIDALA